MARSLRNDSTQHRGTNFCTRSERFAPSFVRQLHSPKWTQTVWNAPKHEFRVQWVDRVRSLRNDSTQRRGTNFCTSSERFAPSFVRQLNGPKCTQMVQNKSLGSNGVDRVRLLRKILTRHRGTNFCTSSKRFTPSFARQPNGCKCTKTWVQPVLHRVS